MQPALEALRALTAVTSAMAVARAYAAQSPPVDRPGELSEWPERCAAAATWTRQRLWLPPPLDELVLADTDDDVDPADLLHRWVDTGRPRVATSAVAVGRVLTVGGGTYVLPGHARFAMSDIEHAPTLVRAGMATSDVGRAEKTGVGPLTNTRHGQGDAGAAGGGGGTASAACRGGPAWWVRSRCDGSTVGEPLGGPTAQVRAGDGHRPGGDEPR